MYYTKIAEKHLFKSRQKRFSGKILKRYIFKWFDVECIYPSLFGLPVFKFFEISPPKNPREGLLWEGKEGQTRRLVKKYSMLIAGIQGILKEIIGWKKDMKRIIVACYRKGLSPLDPRFQIGLSVYNPKDEFNRYIGKCEALDCLFRVLKIKKREM